jgi:hypothetical protein
MCCQSAASKAIPEQADASTAVYGIKPYAQDNLQSYTHLV